MSLARKQAVILGLVWLAIAVVFAVLLADVGIATFSGPGGKATRSVMGAVILPGYLISFLFMWRTRRGRRAGEIDERDMAVERQATAVTAIVLILAVYLFGIGLYEAHAESGQVPAGWLYVLAYGVVVLASLVHPVISLFLDCTGRVDA